MGMSISRKLTSSPDFTAACSAAYAESAAAAQHAFPGIPRYQLLPASLRLHSLLPPALLRWAPSPPTQSLVDSALRRWDPHLRGAHVLDLPAFEGFARELYGEMVRGEVGRKTAVRIAVVAAVGVGVGVVSGGGAGRAAAVSAVALSAAALLSNVM